MAQSLWNGAGQIVRTDGTRSGSDTWAQAKAADQDVDAPPHDEHDESLALSIADTLHRGGQNSPTANLSWGDNKITSLGDATTAQDAVNVRSLQGATYVFDAASTGTSNNYTIALSPANATPVAGMVIRFIADKSNSGAATATVNGTEDEIRTRSGAPLLGREIRTGEVVEMIFDGTNWRLMRIEISHVETDVSSAVSPATVAAGIPAGARRVTILLDQVSMGVADELLIKFGHSGGLESTGYPGVSVELIDATAVEVNNNNIAAMRLGQHAAAVLIQGHIEFNLADPTTNTWIGRGMVTSGGSKVVADVAIAVLDGTLTQIAIDAEGGAAFDAGSVTVLIE